MRDQVPEILIGQADDDLVRLRHLLLDRRIQQFELLAVRVVLFITREVSVLVLYEVLGQPQR